MKKHIFMFRSAISTADLQFGHHSKQKNKAERDGMRRWWRLCNFVLRCEIAGEDSKIRKVEIRKMKMLQANNQQPAMSIARMKEMQQMVKLLVA
jgi:hypothetical protein